MEQFVDLLHHIKNNLLKEKASDVVVSGVISDSSQIKFANNKIVKTGTESLINVGIFFVRDKKIVLTNFKELAGFSGDTPLDIAALNVIKKQTNNLTKKLVKFSKNLEPKKDYYGIAKGPFTYKKIPETFDNKIANLSEEKKVDFVISGINAALTEGAKRTNGIFQTAYNKNFLVTSHNVESQSKGTSAYFSIRALLDKESSGHNTSSERTLKNLDIENTAKFAGRIAKLSKNPVKAEEGIFDVVFAPMAIAVLLNRVGEATSIFDVEAGISFFANKLKSKVANSSVNLIDDATLAGGFGSITPDAEGVPTQRNVLIKKGILQTYLHNTSTAKKYKTKTTASAGLISPGPYNIILEKGNISKDNLFAFVKRGVYITNVWYTRFQNYAVGDFSTIPRDGMFLIENGKIKKPIKNLRVKENMLHLLQNISAVANDTKQITSWEVSIPVITPHVLVKNVLLTKPVA